MALFRVFFSTGSGSSFNPAVLAVSYYPAASLLLRSSTSVLSFWTRISKLCILLLSKMGSGRRGGSWEEGGENGREKRDG